MTTTEENVLKKTTCEALFYKSWLELGKGKKCRDISESNGGSHYAKYGQQCTEHVTKANDAMLEFQSRCRHPKFKDKFILEVELWDGKVFKFER